MERHLVLLCAALAIATYTGLTESRPCWDKQWYNTSMPLTNGSEFEGLSLTDRNALCYTYGPIAAQCADNKREGFTGNKTEPKLQFHATCDVTNGLICHPFPNTTAKCPDLAIQYGCDCQYTGPPPGSASTPTNRPTTPSAATSTAPVTTANSIKQETSDAGSGPSTPPAGSGQNKKQKGRDNGAGRRESTLTMLIGCVVIIQYFFM